MVGIAKVRGARCLLCNGPVTLLGKKRGYHIASCSRCKFAFAYPRPLSVFLKPPWKKQGRGDQEPTLDAILRREREEPNSTIDAKRMIGRMKKYLLAHRLPLTLLDVGAGNGFFSREAIRNGFKVVAIEPETRRLGILSRIAPEADVRGVFFEDLEYEEPFSAILMSQILEHVPFPLDFLTKAFRHLVPGGILAIAVPNFNTYLRFLVGLKDPLICPPIHINYFTSTSLCLFLQRAGFTPIKASYVARVYPSNFRRYLRFPSPLARMAASLANRTVMRAVCHMGKGITLEVHAVKAEERT